MTKAIFAFPPFVNLVSKDSGGQINSHWATDGFLLDKSGLQYTDYCKY